MKFLSVKSRTIYEIETDTGIFYRTNINGSYWERLYGDSWEPVFMNEESECIDLWKKITGVKE